MTSADRDPFPRLADALTEVSARLQDLSTELRALERGPRAAAPAPVPPPWFQPYPPAYGPPPPQYQPYPAQPYAAQPYAPPAQPTVPSPPLPPAEPVPGLWERMSREGAGSRFLAWVGGGVTLAGVLLLLVLAVQRGYIGPLPRVLLGAALGAVLVAVGLALHRAPAGRVGAHAVAATGAAVLYLDTVAVTSLYHYLPALAGLVVGLAVASGGIAVAARWDSQVFATFVVLGAAISAPVLTDGITPLLVGFLLVLQVAASPAHLRRRWSGLAVAAGVPPVVAVTLDVAFTWTSGRHDALSVAALCALATVVQIVLATVTVLREDDDGALGLLLWSVVPTLLSAAVVSRPAGVALVGAVGGVLFAVWALQRAGRLGVPARFADAAAAGAAAAAFEATCLGVDASVRALALLAASALLGVVAARMRYSGALVAGAVFGAAGLLLALTVSLRPHLLLIAPSGRLSARGVLTAGTTGVAVAVAALVLAWASTRLEHRDSDTDRRDTDRRDVDRTAWVSGGLVALYGASGAVLAVGLAFSPDHRGFLAGHVLVTLSWTVGALVLLLVRRDSAALRVGGLSLVVAALAKLVLFDLASLNGIPRVIAFLGGGLVLLAAGVRYAGQVGDRFVADA